MNSSNDWLTSLQSGESALQHARGPRPLPLFLEIVRIAARDEPEIGRAALAGLAAYQQSQRPAMHSSRPVFARRGPAVLSDCGGSGPPAILIPSLINPPVILDLDEQVSLASAIASMGRSSLILDWGPAEERKQLSVADHISELLIPLLEDLDRPPALVGYCLGGTMAVAAANLLPCERVATLASPWRFAAYPQPSRDGLMQLWAQARPTAHSLQMLPIEVLQTAFWSLDPGRIVEKFARFSKLDAEDPRVRRFVALEDWANDGEPLPLPAARELIEDMFGRDLPGSGEWQISGTRMREDPGIPMLHFVATRDRIAPAGSAPDGDRIEMDCGHVGMVVGSARTALHRNLREFLE